MNIFDYIKKEYGDIEYIEEGSSREIYSFANGNYIIKVPLDESFECGVEQSNTEYNVYRNVPLHLKYLLAPIIVCDRNFDDIPLIVMPKVDIISALFDEQYFKSAIDKYGSIEFLNDLAEFIVRFRQSDLIMNSDNWGVLNERLVCVDYGWRMDSYDNSFKYDLEQISQLKYRFIKIA